MPLVYQRLIVGAITVILSLFGIDIGIDTYYS